MANIFKISKFRRLLSYTNKIPKEKNISQLISRSYCQKADDPGIKLTNTCVERIKKIVPEGSFLRLAIDGGGCSGFQYKFDIDSETNPDDKIIQTDGAKLVVDEMSYGYLKGSTVDYHVELIRAAFRVINIPKAEHGCSCGTSFSFKN